MRDRSTSAPVWIGYGSGSSKPLSLYTYVSAVQPPTVTLRPTTTALTATPTTIKRYGRVKLAAAVADPVAPDAAPTGDVTFYVDGAPEATVDLDAAGKAEHTITLGTVGEHSVDAAYCPGADSTYVSSEDEAAVTVTSEKWATATVAEVTPDPSVAWQPATLAATLSQPEGAGPTITGSILFAEDDGTPIGEPVPLDQDGRAELTAGAGAGDYVVRAHYSGDELNAPSDGTATQHVDRQTTTATIDSSDNPAVVGEPFTLYALVEADPPSEGTPSGEVQFTIDGTPAGAPLPLDDSASIAVDVVARQPGRAVIGVRYSGDDDYFASAAQFTETVQPAPTPATSTPPPPGAPPLASPAPRPLTSRQLLSALRVPRTITVRDTRPFRFAKLTSTRVRSLTVELFAKRRATAGRAAMSRTRWLRVGRGRSSGTVVTARLTRAGVRLLRRTRKLRVQARIRAIDDTGATVTATMNRMLQRGARARGSQG